MGTVENQANVKHNQTQSTEVPNFNLSSIVSDSPRRTE